MSKLFSIATIGYVQIHREANRLLAKSIAFQIKWDSPIRPYVDYNLELHKPNDASYDLTWVRIQFK